MHRLALIGMVIRHVLVPMVLESGTRIILSSVTSEGVVDLGWLVHDFSRHHQIPVFAIPLLVVWERRLTLCLLMVALGCSETAGSNGVLSSSKVITRLL